jgi:hypothetical protein
VRELSWLTELLFSLVRVGVSVLHLQEEHEERHGLVRHLWKENKPLHDGIS